MRTFRKRLYWGNLFWSHFCQRLSQHLEDAEAGELSVFHYLPPKHMILIGYPWNSTASPSTVGFYACCHAAPRVWLLRWKIMDVLCSAVLGTGSVCSRSQEPSQTFPQPNVPTEATCRADAEKSAQTLGQERCLGWETWGGPGSSQLAGGPLSVAETFWKPRSSPAHICAVVCQEAFLFRHFWMRKAVTCCRGALPSTGCLSLEERKSTFSAFICQNSPTVIIFSSPALHMMKCCPAFFCPVNV